MVLISHRYKFIYLKNFKVAGSSIESFFGQFCIDPALQTSYQFIDSCDESITTYGIVNKRYSKLATLDNTLFVKSWKKEYALNDHDDASIIIWFPHKSAEHIKKDIGDQIFNQYLKFCVVRNPYDAFVSAYFWEKIYNNLTWDFKTFCIRSCKDLSELKITNYIRHDDNRLFINGTPICDYYIRYEHLKEDTLQLLEKLGITDYSLDDLPHHKRSLRPKDKPYQEYYDDETKALIYTIFKNIFDMFNYTF